jgi:hypothetical protein
MIFYYKFFNYYLITFINNNKYRSQQSNHYWSGYHSHPNFVCIFQTVSETQVNKNNYMLNLFKLRKITHDTSIFTFA